MGLPTFGSRLNHLEIRTMTLSLEERQNSLNIAADALPVGVMDGQRLLLLDDKPVGFIHSQVAEHMLQDLSEAGAKGFSAGGPSEYAVVRHGLDDMHLAEIGRPPPSEEEQGRHTADMLGFPHSMFPKPPALSTEPMAKDRFDLLSRRMASFSKGPKVDDSMGNGSAMVSSRDGNGR